MGNRRSWALLVGLLVILAVASPFTTCTLNPKAAGATSLVITPTFQVYLMTPSTNPARQQWALLIANNLQALGIQAQRVIVDWDTILASAMYPTPDVIGKKYVDGGFDALFVGDEVPWDADPYRFYHSSQIPPTGSNYYLWENSQNDQLLEKIRSETNWTKWSEYLKQWQVLAYDELPSIAIYYSKDKLVLMDSHMNETAFQKYHYPLWPNIELWQFDDSTNSATLGQRGLLASLSPLHSTSYYDLGYSAPVYGEGAGYGLVRRGYDYRMTDYMAYGNWTVTPDGKNWTFWVRPGILFHNGEELDARDVVATQRAIMSPAYACPLYSYAKSVLGGNTSVYFAGEAGTPGVGLSYNKYEIHFDLPSAWAFFLQEFGAASIYPASVLLNGTYNFATQDYVDMQPAAGYLAGFRSTSFGAPTDIPYSYTMKNGSLKTYVGPIGAGPYTYDGYSVVDSSVHLQKNSDYFRKPTLEAQGYLQLNDYYCRYVPGSGAAVAGLMGGQIDVWEDDSTLFDTLILPDPSWKWVSHESLGIQELGFNMRHPILGTGVETPLGSADPSRAAEAAKHVRKAFDYLTPKKDICNVLLNGFALPGLTTACLLDTPVFDFTLYNGPNYRNGSTGDAQFNAMQELRLAGYSFVALGATSFWETYGLLITVAELAVIVVLLVGFYFYRPRKV